MRGWTCGGRNFGRGENFPSRVDRSWGQPSLYTLDTGSNPGQSGREMVLTTPSHLEPRLKKGAELYVYFHSPLGPSRQVVGETLLLLYKIKQDDKMIRHNDVFSGLFLLGLRKTM